MIFVHIKDKGHLIEVLKKAGDDIISVKSEIIYAFPRGMYDQQKVQINKSILADNSDFKYYRSHGFVKKIKKVK